MELVASSDFCLHDDEDPASQPLTAASPGAAKGQPQQPQPQPQQEQEEAMATLYEYDDGWMMNHHVLWQGPPHALTLRWAASAGAEYVAMVLWIAKDWSWSEVGWTVTAATCGTAAALWIVTTHVVGNVGLGSELYKGVVMSVWLGGLYGWMMGDMWALWFADTTTTTTTTTATIMMDPQQQQQEPQQVDVGQTMARVVLLLAVVLFTIFFLVLLPMDVFAADRTSPVIQRIAAKSPPCPRVWAAAVAATGGCGGGVPEFRMYAALHFYTWVLKDCMWAWELPTVYFLAFCVTIALNIDLLYRFARHGSYIDFWNYVVILLWVVANGLWAFGELVANAAATDDQFRTYQWPHWHKIQGATFQFRYAAGWVFFMAAAVLIVFYTHWIVRTWQARLPPFVDDECDDDDGGGVVALPRGTMHVNHEQENSENGDIEETRLVPAADWDVPVAQTRAEMT